MKKIFFVILFSFIVLFGFSQPTVFIRGDTVKIKKEGGNSNLVIENSTRGVTNGVLTNIGNGVTRFILPSGSPGSFVDSVTKNVAGDSFYVWKGGIYSVLADRGITNIPTLQQVFDTEAGGSILTKIDTILAGSDYLQITGNIATGVKGTLNIINTASGGMALQTYTTDGISIHAVDLGAGNAVYGESVGAEGIAGLSTNGLGGSMNIRPASTNTLAEVFRIYRSTSGTAANGIGGYIGFNPQLSNSDLSKSAGGIGYIWSNATSAGRTSQATISTVNNTVTATAVTINGNGSTKFNKYGLGTFTGTPAYSLAVDASGNIIEDVAGGGGGSSDTSVIIIDTTYNPTASVNTGGDTLIEKSIDIQLNGSSITPTSDTRKMLFNIVTGVGSVPTLYSQDDSLTSSRRAFIGDGKELRFVSHSIVNNDSVVVAQDKNQWSANYQGSAGIDGFVVNRGLHEATMYSQSDLTGKQHIIKTDTTGAYIESNSVYMRLVPTSGTVIDSAFGRDANGKLAYRPVSGFSYTPFTEEYTSSTSTVKTLTHTASAFMIPAAFVTMNGVLFDEANYSISGTTLTLSGVTVLTTDIIKVKYYY